MKAEDRIYSAERLLDTRMSGGKRQYLVKWKGWSIGDSTWEPVANILDKRLVQEFQRRGTTPITGLTPTTAGSKRKSAPASFKDSPLSGASASSPKRDRRSDEDIPSTSAKSPRNAKSPAKKTADTPRGSRRSAKQVSPKHTPNTPKSKANTIGITKETALDAGCSWADIHYLQIKVKHEIEVRQVDLEIIRLKEKKTLKQIENAKAQLAELQRMEKAVDGK